MRLCKRRKAFTLVELIIVIAIMGIVFDIIYQTQSSNRNIFPKANAKSNIQQDVRLAADFVSKDLRFARSVTILPDKPDTFNDNLVYIYSDGNNIVYRKNGATRNIMLSENSRTVTLIFTHSTSGSFNDGKTVNFTIEGKTSEEFKLNSKVEILNLNKNIIHGDNGYCICYSLTDFVNNPPVVTSINPLDVGGGVSIKHYNYDYEDTMDSSITVSGSTLPTPFSVTPFFIESDVGDSLTYSVSSDYPDVLAVSIDSSNLIHFTLNSIVTADTNVDIQINAVDNYGGSASTKFQITVTTTASFPLDTISFINSGNKTYLKDSGTKEIDLTNYFNYNPAANVTFTAAKADGTVMAVTNNKLQVPTSDLTGDSGYNVTVTATLTKSDATTLETSGSINIVIKEAQIWFEDANGNIKNTGTSFTLPDYNSYYLYIKTNDPSLIISCSPIPSKSDESINHFKVSYDSSNNGYTLTPQNQNASITIDAYVQGYENSEDAYKHISITINR